MLKLSRSSKRQNDRCLVKPLRARMRMCTTSLRVRVHVHATADVQLERKRATQYQCACITSGLGTCKSVLLLALRPDGP